MRLHESEQDNAKVALEYAVFAWGTCSEECGGVWTLPHVYDPVLLLSSQGHNRSSTLSKHKKLQCLKERKLWWRRVRMSTWRRKSQDVDGGPCFDNASKDAITDNHRLVSCQWITVTILEMRLSMPHMKRIVRLSYHRSLWVQMFEDLPRSFVEVHDLETDKQEDARHDRAGHSSFGDGAHATCPGSHKLWLDQPLPLKCNQWSSF